MNLSSNGKPSNLTPEQYKLVRTKAFKDWFGDWENEPENASKVVDSNGEPLVIYRGMSKNVSNNYKFDFKTQLMTSYKRFNKFGFYFTDNLTTANEYANHFAYNQSFEEAHELNKTEGKWTHYDEIIEKSKDYEVVISYFLNLKNFLNLTPSNPKFPKYKEGQLINFASDYKYKDTTISLVELLDLLDLKQDYIDYVSVVRNINLNDDWANIKKDVFTYFTEFKGGKSYGLKSLAQYLKHKILQKYDGVVFFESMYSPSNIYVAFSSNQIKLADGTNTTFDGNNPDIRYDLGGEVIPKGKEGDCYKNVQDYLLDNDLPNAFIVHGEVTNGLGKTIGHAWIVNGVNVIDPTTGVITTKENYYERLNPKEEARYNIMDAIKMRFKTQNYGAWTDAEVEKILGNGKKFGGGEVPEGAKLLPLTMGKFAIVDAEDFDWLSEYKWRLGIHRGGNKEVVNYYGQRTIYTGVKNASGGRGQMVITLGKQILGIPESKELRADYIDGDNLNCQKSNLRIASVTQINYTKSKFSGETTSKYKGVSKKIDVRRSHIWWLASIKPTKDGKLLEKAFPFTPEGEILAGKQYDEWAKKYQGDFAVLNFLDDKYAKGGGVGYVSYRDKYNKKYGYEKNESHSLKEISKDTGVSNKGLQKIYNKGIGAFKTNPSSVRPNVKSKEQWAKARVYSAVMGGKAARVDAKELKMNNGGEILLAPNGKLSNLTSEQYRLVRTPAFKAWFGDWERLANATIKDPAIDVITLGNISKDVSKVVDENGEPLVVYHGSKSNRFNSFNIISETHRGVEVGSHFGTYIQSQKIIAQRKSKNLAFQLYEVFLCIKNIIRVDDINWWTPANINKFIFQKNKIKISSNNPSAKDVIEQLNKEKINGFIYSNLHEGGHSYVVFNPNQIKLADGTNTTFDGSNPDIRYSGGGGVGYVSYRDKYNKKYGYGKNESHSLKEISKDTGVSNKGLQKIYNKGIGAFKTNPSSVRPNVKSKEQWAKARVYSAVMGGKAARVDAKELKMNNGGEILLAPNRKPSNLTAEQYRIVRTPAFKEWFGDWENNPSEASKVVDENGEPLIVYHFSDLEFNIFELKGISKGFFFTENKKDDEFSNISVLELINKGEYPNWIKKLMEQGLSIEEIIEGVYFSRYEKSKSVFLNIKKMYPLSWVGEVSEKNWSVPYFENIYIEKAKERNFNGIEFVRELDNKKIVVVFEPNQIKLADGSNITFDGSNPDIRYSGGGYIGSCVDIGSSNKEVCEYFPNATIMAEYVGNPDENEWGKSKETTPKEFYKYVSKDDVPKKAINGEHTYHYIAQDGSNRDMNINETAIYFIYNIASDIHYFFKKTKYKTGGDLVNEPYISDNFQIGPNGAYEHTEENEIINQYADGVDLKKKLKKPKKPKGDCYYAAAQLVMGNRFKHLFGDNNITYIGTPYLVHAEVRGQGKVANIRFGHAWIEDDENIYDYSNGNQFVMPKEIYYAIGDIDNQNPLKYQKYTFEEARRKMVTTRHYGEWDLEVDC